MTLDLDKSAWKRVPFGELVQNVNDYYDKGVDGALPYVAGPHITPRQPTIGKYGSTDDGELPPTFKRKFRQGDVLLHSRGIDKLAAVDRVGVTGEKLFVLRSTDEKLLMQEFVLWGLLSSEAQARLADHFTGSVNKFLNWAPLAKLHFPLPPLGEQKRIAELLSAVERHRVALGVQLEAVSAALRLCRARYVNDPKASELSAREVFDFSAGVRRTPDRAVGKHMTRYLRSANVGYGRLDLTDVHEMNFQPAERERFKLLPGDVLVTEGSASATAVGMPARWEQQLPGTICFQMTLMRLRAKPEWCTPGFLYQWCMWAYESGAFLGVAGGTNIKHISVLRSSQLMVRLPSLEEQEEIVDRLETMTRAVSSLREEVECLESLRGALLSGIFGED